jgi:hypothetical protein
MRAYPLVASLLALSTLSAQGCSDSGSTDNLAADAANLKSEDASVDANAPSIDANGTVDASFSIADAAVADAASADAMVYGDCRDATCMSPFVCRENLPNKYECHSAAGDLPNCQIPPAIEVPIMGGIGQARAHWILGSCIQVTYESSLAAQATEIANAIAAWNAIPCNQLCLSGPTLDDSVPPSWEAVRRIRIFSGASEWAVPNYEFTTGRIRKARIRVNGTPTGPDWIRLIGRTLGLGTPASTVHSIMLPQSGTPTILQPTAADETSICVAYGTPPLCGE